MTAGESADDEARRLREQARRLDQRADNFERGADGERRIATILDGLPEEYVVYHDLKLPAPSRANVDHLVVGPTRIVAIDTKNYSNPVTIGSGRGAGKLWTGRRPITSLETCAWEASVVAEAIGLPIESVMCIIAPALPSSSFDFDGVRVCSPARLLGELTSTGGEVIDHSYATQVIEREFGVARAARPVAHTTPLASSSARSRQRSDRATIPVGTQRSNPVRAVVRAFFDLLDRAWFRFTLLCVASIVGLALLPTIMSGVTKAGESAGRQVAENLQPVRTTTPSTTTTQPPIVQPPPRSAGIADCGQIPTSWLLTFAWPGDLPLGADGYHVSWQLDSGHAVVIATPEPWADAGSAPANLRVSGDAAATVHTGFVDDDGEILATRTDKIARPATCRSG